MLKKISVKQLAVGMCLKKFSGSWMEHPFWRNSFVITDPGDIERIRASSIREVWIDCSKGIDVAADEPAVSEAESESRVEAELADAAQAVRETAPVSISGELARAAKICAQAKRAVTSMFQEARMGKAMMPMEVLNKPGKLADDEFRIMQSHPEEGCKLLQESPGVDDITFDVVLHHHEKTDGSGYPKSLKDSEISFHAKMAEWVDGHFDSVVFQAFVKSLGIYPIGSLLRLRSDRRGVVIDQSTKSLLTPRIKVFFSTRGNARIKPEIIDLSVPNCTDRIAGREDPSKWNFADLDELRSGQTVT